MKTAIFPLILPCLLAQGCSIFLPANQNSYDLKGERVSVRMLSTVDLCNLQNDLNKNNSQNKAVNIGLDGDACKPKGEEFAFAAPLAAAAAGFAMDFIKKRMEEEASHYEAQFSKRKAEQDFWIFKQPKVKDKNGKEIPKTDREGKSMPVEQKLNYAGFEIVRETIEHPYSDPAFRMVFTFMSSNDGTALMIKPTYIREASAKAKVLSNWSVASWFNWFTKADGEVEVNVDVKLDAFWTDEKNISHQDRVASYPLNLGNFDLNKITELDQKDLVEKEGGWFGAIPCSNKAKKDDNNKCGNFWLEVTVTEKDTSNAKKYLEEGAQLAADKKETVINLVAEKISK